MRSVPLAARRGRPTATQRLASGQWLTEFNAVRILQDLPVGEVLADSVDTGLLEPLSSADIPLARVSRGELVTYNMGPNGPKNVTTVPLSPRDVAVAMDNTIWIANTWTGVIRVHGSDGKLKDSFTLPVPRRLLDRALLNRVRDRMVAEAESPAVASRIRAGFGVTLPSRAPAFTSLTKDGDGNVWIELFREDAAKPATILVIDGLGRQRARVELPVGFQPTDIGSDYLLGVETDSNGMETVVQYSLRRAQ